MFWSEEVGQVVGGLCSVFKCVGANGISFQDL